MLNNTILMIYISFLTDLESYIYKKPSRNRTFLIDETDGWTKFSTNCHVINYVNQNWQSLNTSRLINSGLEGEDVCTKFVNSPFRKEKCAFRKKGRGRGRSWSLKAKTDSGRHGGCAVQPRCEGIPRTPRSKLGRSLEQG